MSDDRQAALIDAMSEDEVLGMLGPSWSAMTVKQRENYGHRYDPLLGPIIAETEAMWVWIAAKHIEAEHQLRVLTQPMRHYQLLRRQP